ncbi:MAG: SRPBCC family protein [Cryomorphaceae bacterium]
MKVYRLTKTQVLPISMEEAWGYFSNPSNLQEITPKELRFNVLTNIEHEHMYAGQIINYIVTPILGIAMRWTTEITHVESGKYFVDEQRFGPYSFWHHKHFFEPVEGGVLATDIIDYALPFGFLGRVANRMFVKRQIETIFDFREHKLHELFGAMDESY